MAQKNASPTQEQARILQRNGLNKIEWVVVQDFRNSMIVKHRGTGEFNTIYK